MKTAGNDEDTQVLATFAEIWNKFSSNRNIAICGAGAGLLFVAIAGLFLDVMDVDAAQYASIALEMTQNGSWLQVMHRGTDYLDKPPLLFWLVGSLI
jgi:4-amino-4-deoxy-L-arabinose transferase-like glycosyltransferase